MQRRAYALVGAAAAIAAAVGPLIGGLITTYLSWRIAFAGEVVIIAIVLVGTRRVNEVPYTGPREIDLVGAVLSALGMGGLVLGILVWEDGSGPVAALISVGVVALGSLVWWLRRRKREGKAALIDVGLFASPYFRLGITSQTMQQIALGGLMIALPIYLQMVLEYNALEAGLSIAPLSLSMFVVALVAGKKAAGRSPSRIILVGFVLLAAGVAVLLPIVPRADSGLAMAVPLIIAGAGLGLLVSQLNNYTLSPIEEEHVSEAAGVNSAGGSFGLSFGLAFAGAIMLASLSLVFTDMADSSDVLTPAQQTQVADTLEHSAEVMSNSDVQELLAERTARGAGRDHRHQHRRAPDRPADRPARPAAGRPDRHRHRIPDDAAGRSRAVRGGREHARGLTPLAHHPTLPCVPRVRAACSVRRLSSPIGRWLPVPLALRGRRTKRRMAARSGSGTGSVAVSGTRGSGGRSARPRPTPRAGCRTPGCRRRRLSMRARCIRFQVMNVVLRRVNSFSGPPLPGSA